LSAVEAIPENIRINILMLLQSNKELRGIYFSLFFSIIFDNLGKNEKLDIKRQP